MFVLGPGAYSLDSKMFGRRLILPNSKLEETAQPAKRANEP
jgi:hypothetical protein